jgi:predicted DNA-binding transcriptional regulator AlpA
MSGRDPLVTPKAAAAHLAIGRSTLDALRKREGLPAVVLTTGPGGRATVRYRLAEIEAWLQGRRERQLAATVKGDRYRRRSAEVRS